MEKHPIELKTGGPIGLAPDGSVVSDCIMARGQARRAEITTSSGEISFTLIESHDRLSKKFDLAPDGSVIPTGSTQLYRGAFVLATFDTGPGVAAVLSEIGALFDALSSKQALVLGVMKDGIAQGTIVTVEVFEKGGTTALTRSQMHLGWPSGLGLLFFDGDGVNDLPTRLPELYPPLADAAMLVRPSASASVADPATGKALSESEHCFVAIDDPAQSKACLNALMRLAWVKGSGRLELKKNGVPVPKGPIDVMVGSAERLVYEGAAEIHPRLTTLPRKSRVVGGQGILCAADLVAYADLHAPEAQYKALIEAAKRKPDFVAKRKEVMTAYRTDHVERGVARGEPREKVEKTFDKMVRARTKQKGDRLWKELSPHHTFYRDRGEAFSGLDLLANPMAFHKTVCADPVEGMDYQTTNCGWIVITAEQINIYSQAHGGAYAYFIKMPAGLLFQTQMKQVNEAMASSSTASSSASSFFKSSSSSSSPPPPPPSAPAVTVVDNPLNAMQPFAEVAELMLKRLREQGEDLLIVADEKDVEHLWRYGDGLWSLVSDPETWLNLQIEITLRDAALRKFSFSKFVAEARKYVERSPDIRSEKPIVWNDHGKVPTRSGLIDPVTLKVEPLKKEDYATWRIEIDYDPKAVCPLLEELLGDYFVEHTEAEKSITLLQELLGTSLIDRLPKALKYALVLWGASDTGKSQLLRILSGLTSDNPIGTPLSEINKTHGLEEFTRRAPWVLDEAFDISVWHLSAHVKAIIARETLGINVKNHPLLTMPIYAPAFWGTNHSPTFKENTEAMVNRLKIVPLKRVFKKGEYVGVARKARAVNPAWEPCDLILAQEKAGLLNWALKGLQRVLKRGYFVDTVEGVTALDAMRQEANPVSGFVRDCISFDPEKMMSTADFYAAFTGWREETHGGEQTTISRNIVGKNLGALAHPRIGQDKNTFKEANGRRYYVGIAFNAEGAAHFDAVKTSWHRRAEWVTQGTSLTAKEAVLAIPDKWLDHPVVKQIKKLATDDNEQQPPEAA